MTRNFYDVLVQESSLGDAQHDLERYCELAQQELERELEADVRVRLTGDGDSYTYVGANRHTHDGPLTDEMAQALARAYTRWIA